MAVELLGIQRIGSCEARRSYLVLEGDIEGRLRIDVTFVCGASMESGVFRRYHVVAIGASMQSKLNVGCGRNIMDGDWLNLDHAALPGVQIVYDLERCATVPLPLADDSMDEFLLSHVIEHLHATLPLMQELHRVAKPNAKAVIRVPYGSSDDAWEDPTHVRGYFRGSFGYFSQPFYWRADYGYRGDWQVEKLIFRVEKQVYAGQNVNSIMDDVTTKRNVVKEMIAEMRAIKPIREPLLALQTQMPIEIFLS